MVRLTPRLPRVVLKSNSQYGQQDPRSQDARSSWDPPSDSKSYGETSYHFQQVEQQDTTRENKVKKFSKESQEPLADMNNAEIFELIENASKQQCPECNTYWEIGIIYCSCERNMKSSRSPAEFDQNNRDVTSIPGYVIKKTAVVGQTRTF